MCNKHVLFLIIHFIVSISSQQRSLVFVFDTTGSMGEDLENFKKGADVILNSMSAMPNAPIRDYVLVPYHDPGYGPVIVTQDANHFRKALENIYVAGGEDCPEMCFSALLEGIGAGLPNSYIYVMTDAKEKDTHLLDSIEDSIQRRKSQVTFLLREAGGECGNANFENYEKVALASSGQVFYMDESDEIFEVLKYVNRTIDENRIDISYAARPSGIRNETIAVDETLRNIIIIISGGNTDIKIIDPTGQVVNDCERIVNLPRVKAVEIVKPSIGIWTVMYENSDRHTIKVTGVSTIKFEYGFTSRKTTNFAETTSRPFLGIKNRILVTVTEGKNQVKSINSIELANSTGGILFSSEVMQLLDSNIFESNEFSPPESFFYVIIYGKDKNGNVIKRVSPTAIQSQRPEKPYITLENNNVGIAINDDLTLDCKVDSLVPIVVKWMKNSEELKKNDFQQSGVSRLLLKNVDKSYEGEYRCEASNIEGFNEKNFSVTVNERKLVDETTTEPFDTKNITVTVNDFLDENTIESINTKHPNNRSSRYFPANIICALSVIMNYICLF